ncbi:MAG: hypothetical protein P8130_08405 [Deltaproteobacteria bacterium]
MKENAPGHVSLVELIKASYLLFDVGALGLLRLVGEQMAGDRHCADVLEETVSGIGEGIFVQKRCPFSGTIGSYKSSCRELPQELVILADHANQQGAAWVSAFCGIHQAYRRARFGSNYRHVACRFEDKRSIASQEYVAEPEANRLLQEYACIFVNKAVPK